MLRLGLHGEIHHSRLAISAVIPEQVRPHNLSGGNASRQVEVLDVPQDKDRLHFPIDFQQRRFPMLVLSRKAGERVLIGHNIAVRVIDVQGNRVKLGFDCPRGVSIVREELIDRDARLPWELNEGCDESIYHAEFA
jgi:carbon storage regulator